MRRRRPHIGLVLITALMLACPGAGDSPPPGITAQGFRLEQPRAGLAGSFSDIRLRFEVATGIEHLVVRERSFEIDLAKSPDVSNVALFGIERRVWSKRDVTLDFAPYLNEKLLYPGEYALHIQVEDREGRLADATLNVVVDPEPAAREEAQQEQEEGEPPSAKPAADVGNPAAPPAGPVASEARSESTPLGEERPFRLQRVGAGPIEGDERFGITWKTIDEIAVVIQMTSRDDVPARLARLDPAAFTTLATHEDLNRMLDRMQLADTLEIPTASSAAAGAVIAIVHPDQRYLLRTDHSTTSLSELGTTVTLSGRYRD